MNAGEQFGVRLRELRKARGLSISALAYRAGISIPTVGTYERGERNATVEKAGWLARALDVELSHLLDPQAIAGSEDTAVITDGELREALTARIRRQATEATDEDTIARMGPRWGQVLLAELAVTVGAYKRLEES